MPRSSLVAKNSRSLSPNKTLPASIAGLFVKKLAKSARYGIFYCAGSEPPLALSGVEERRQPWLAPAHSDWPGMRVLNLRYHKRFQMELDLRRWRRQTLTLHPDYRLRSWSDDLIRDHAEAKYHSFRDELDAVVFPCLGEPESCLRLMHEIRERDGFVPEATWLAQYIGAGPRRIESCGTIQAIRVNRARANIQNIGVTPIHRGRGVGAALILAAVTGLHQVGVTRVALEVTAVNGSAVRLYQRIGFRAVKTVYKAIEELPERRHSVAH